jgi:hypothetical protein
MIECIFSIDYEIYGNGEGSIRELVYEPAERLKAIFDKWNARFVAFIEVAELEMIEANKTDPAIDLVKNQIRRFYREGYELGLHLHPQWYNARYLNGKWQLDYDEYNLCTLALERVDQMVDRSIEYVRNLLGVSDFTPFSFRAGNWLFQPTLTAAKVLIKQGVKVDSSVFKGGLQHQHKLDYRRAIKNGYYWPFKDDVNVPDRQGTLIEFPIFTKMVPLWKLLTLKRIGLQQKVPTRTRARKERLFRLLDFLRLYHPIKFDFCRMTMKELTHMLNKEILQDQKDPDLFRPLVAIGHTKDLIDFATVDSLLSILRRQNIPISTFREMYHKYNFNNHQIKA